MAFEKTGEKARGERTETAQGLQKPHPSRVLSPFDEMDRMFDRFFSHNWLHPMRWEWPAWAERMTPFEGKMPRVDIIDRENEVLLRAEIPGVQKDDLEVSLNENTVTIRGHSRHEEKEEKGEYCRREMSYGEFTRTLALPAEVDSTKGKAVFKDGLLELTLPKIETAKRRSIPIQEE